MTNSNPLHRSEAACSWAIAAWLAAAFFLLNAAGCGAAKSGGEIDNTYGRVRGGAGGQSVSGTGALARMFEAAGWKAYTWGRLSPWLYKHDVIVWAPDDFQPPTAQQRLWLNSWLVSGNRQRTLIYIARDFDAASAYWKAVQPGAPPGQAQELARRQAQAQADFASERAAIPDKLDAAWFTTDTSQPIRRVKSLEGPWSKDIDPAKTEIELGTRLKFDNSTSEVERLLESNGEVIVASMLHGFGGMSGYNSYGGRGELIVVTNGSFLLNAPLVNKEHRKLAARLIAECRSPSTVVFLESDAGGPPISDKDTSDTTRSPFDMLEAFPMGLILLHASFAGLVACAWLYPIFGTPRTLRAATRTDFGQHVRAVGSLMARNQNAAYAHRQLAAYQEQVPKQAPRAASGRALPARRKRAAPVQAPKK